jgi:hypothetical protein
MDKKTMERQLLAASRRFAEAFAENDLRGPDGRYPFCRFYPRFEQYVRDNLQSLRGVYFGAGDRFGPVTKLFCQWFAPLAGKYVLSTRVELVSEAGPKYVPLGVRYDDSQDVNWSIYATDNEIDHFFHRVADAAVYRPLLRYQFDQVSHSIELLKSVNPVAWVKGDKVGYYPE